MLPISGDRVRQVHPMTDDRASKVHAQPGHTPHLSASTAVERKTIENKASQGTWIREEQAKHDRLAAPDLL